MSVDIKIIYSYITCIKNIIVLGATSPVGIALFYMPVPGMSELTFDKVCDYTVDFYVREIADCPCLQYSIRICVNQIVPYIHT